MVEALWRLNLFPKERLPEVAAQALVAGNQSSAWLDLASYDAISTQGIDRAFELAMTTLGKPPMELREAAIHISRYVAREIFEGRIHPREGAGLILDHIYYKVDPPDERLGPFCYWADEFDEAGDKIRRQLCEAGIIEASRTLLANDAALKAGSGPAPL